MSRQMDSATVPNMNDRLAVSGWETDTELVREFNQSVNVADAVSSTVDEAIQQWSELSESPPLYQFVDVEGLDGLFKTEATDGGGWLPSAKFQFQSCRVTLLYSSSIRVIVERDP